MKENKGPEIRLSHKGRCACGEKLRRVARRWWCVKCHALYMHNDGEPQIGTGFKVNQ